MKPALMMTSPGRKLPLLQRISSLVHLRCQVPSATSLWTFLFLPTKLQTQVSAGMQPASTRVMWTHKPVGKPHHQHSQHCFSPCWKWPSPVWEQWLSWWEPVVARGYWWRWSGRKWGTRLESRRTPFVPAADGKKEGVKIEKEALEKKHTTHS